MFTPSFPLSAENGLVSMGAPTEGVVALKLRCNSPVWLCAAAAAADADVVKLALVLAWFVEDEEEENAGAEAPKRLAIAVELGGNADDTGGTKVKAAAEGIVKGFGLVVGLDPTPTGGHEDQALVGLALAGADSAGTSSSLSNISMTSLGSIGLGAERRLWR